jgi:hypothetical protein
MIIFFNDHIQLQINKIESHINSFFREFHKHIRSMIPLIYNVLLPKLNYIHEIMEMKI